MSDSIPSPQAQYFWNLIQEQALDVHPNVHALRLKLLLVAQSAGYPTQWNVANELSMYISKLRNVSTVCRLTIQEEYNLLSTVSGDYKLINRKRYLELVMNGLDSMVITYPSVRGGLLEKEFDSIVDKAAVDVSAPTAFLSSFTVLSYKQPGPLKGPQAVAALHKYAEAGIGLHGTRDDLGFLFLYELLTASLPIQILPTDDPYNLGCMFIRYLNDRELYDTGLLMSTLRILQRNYALAHDPQVPKLQPQKSLVSVKFKGLGIQASIDSILRHYR